MFNIKVERLLDKEIEAVFAALTDHANYKQFPGISDSRLLEEGREHRNGAGALRRIAAGPVTLFERITSCEEPVAMYYRIEKTTPIPMRHDRGEITLEDVDGQTRVTWISEGHMQVPLVGTLLDKVVERRITRVFEAILSYIERA